MIILSQVFFFLLQDIQVDQDGYLKGLLFTRESMLCVEFEPMCLNPMFVTQKRHLLPCTTWYPAPSRSKTRKIVYEMNPKYSQ